MNVMSLSNIDTTDFWRVSYLEASNRITHFKSHCEADQTFLYPQELVRVHLTF